MSTQTFKGHGIEPLFRNILLGMAPSIMLLLMLSLQNRGLLFFDAIYYAFMFSVITNYSHPTYLFFEVKHLVIKDGIAEDGSLASILVFGGISLLGLISQVTTIVLVLQIHQLSGFFLIIILSFIASFGGCLGLTDLHMIEVVFPCKVLKHCLLVIKSWLLILVCVSTTALLSFLTSLFVSL